MIDDVMVSPSCLAWADYVWTSTQKELCPLLAVLEERARLVEFKSATWHKPLRFRAQSSTSKTHRKEIARTDVISHDRCCTTLHPKNTSGIQLQPNLLPLKDFVNVWF